MRLSGKTIEMIAWILKKPHLERRILVPNRKRRQEIIDFAKKELGISLKDKVVIADEMLGLKSEAIISEGT